MPPSCFDATPPLVSLCSIRLQHTDPMPLFQSPRSRIQSSALDEICGENAHSMEFSRGVRETGRRVAYRGLGVMQRTQGTTLLGFGGSNQQSVCVSSRKYPLTKLFFSFAFLLELRLPPRTLTGSTFSPSPNLQHAWSQRYQCRVFHRRLLFSLEEVWLVLLLFKKGE